jgi:hypothetical protein
VRRAEPAAFNLYSLGDYNGEWWSSDRTIFDLGHWRWNDKAQSIRVSSGYGVIVCEHADFHGVCGRATGPAEWSDINALAQGLRDNVSSIRVCSGSCPEAGPSPDVLYPMGDTVVEVGNSVVLQWSGSLTKFRVEIWGGALNETRRYGWTSEVSWDVGVLPESASPYYWHVQGWRGYGETGWTRGSFYVSTVDDTPPTGTVTLPGNKSYQSGPSVTFGVDAADVGQGVNRVEFYVWLDDHWQLVGSDTMEPYRYTWNIEDVREGGVWVSADIIDNAGNHSGMIWDPDWRYFIVDKSPPTSQMLALPTVQTSTEFIVRWKGNDNYTPTDLIFYNVQYQENCTGEWLDWFVMNNWEGWTFNGADGMSYCFRSQAVDLPGNTESWPEAAEVRTQIQLSSLAEPIYLPLVER